MPSSFAINAFQLFLRPRRKKKKNWRGALSPQSKSIFVESIQQKITVHQWGDGSKKILLCHGWESQTSDFVAYIRVLSALGYTLIGVDAPAHGESEGRELDIKKYVESITAVLKSHGPFEAAIGHSFGCLSLSQSLLAEPKLAPQKLIFLSSPMNLLHVFSKAFDLFSLSPGNRLAILRKLELHYETPLEKFIVKPSANNTSPQLLLVHDENDEIIGLENSKEIQRRWPGSQLLVTQSLGHFKILRHRGLTEQIIQFISQSQPTISTNRAA